MGKVNNKNNRPDLFKKAEMADYGLGPGGNFNRAADEAAYERIFLKRSGPLTRYTCRITGEEYCKIDGCTIDWDHLSVLAEQALNESGFTNLPWNIGNLVNAGVAPGTYPRFASKAGAERVVKKVQRFCGWIKAARKYPAVRRVIQKTQSSDGVNAYMTQIKLWEYAEKNPSPGKLEHKLWKVKRRAEAILTAYEGQKPSWISVAKALLVTNQTGKAAVIAVAISLSGRSNFRKYRDARDWLVDLHHCKVDDATDGVVSRREEKPRLAKARVEVFRIAVPQIYKGHQVGVRLQFLVRSADGRTFHQYCDTPVEAIRYAIQAWKIQDKLARKDADLISFLRGEMGYCLLIFREDSHSAGNCFAGTESWVREQGWNGRNFIPAVWLIPHLADRLVRNVAMGLYLRYAQQKTAA